MQTITLTADVTILPFLYTDSLIKSFLSPGSGNRHLFTLLTETRDSAGGYFTFESHKPLIRISCKTLTQHIPYYICMF